MLVMRGKVVVEQKVPDKKGRTFPGVRIVVKSRVDEDWDKEVEKGRQERAYQDLIKEMGNR